MYECWVSSEDNLKNIENFMLTGKKALVVVISDEHAIKYPEEKDGV